MVDTKLTEVDSATIRRVPSEAARVMLVVYDGEAPVPTTRVVELADGGRVTVGRSRTADIVVDSERISRVHASFARTGVDVEVSDLGSRNGTWVNGEQIAGPRRLVSGDEVLIGSVTVVVNITTGTAVRPRLESTRYLEERLAAEVDRGLTYQRRFGFLLVALDGPAELVDAATDLISASLRPMEVIAEYAPAVLAIILPELDAAAALRTGRELIAKPDCPPTLPSPRGSAWPWASRDFPSTARPRAASWRGPMPRSTRLATIAAAASPARPTIQGRPSPTRWSSGIRRWRGSTRSSDASPSTRSPCW